MRKSIIAIFASLSLVAGALWLVTASPAGAAKGVKSSVSITKSASTQTQRNKPRIVLTATVRPKDGRRARGYVSFRAGGTFLTKAAVHQGVARAKLPRNTEPGGYKIRAIFRPKAGSGLAESRSPGSKTSRVRIATNPSDRKWDKLAECEAGGNWRTNTGNGYYGGLQFSRGTWKSIGGDGMPHKAPRLEQIDMGKKLKKRSGASQWPVCGKVL